MTPRSVYASASASVTPTATRTRRVPGVLDRSESLLDGGPARNGEGDRRLVGGPAWLGRGVPASWPGAIGASLTSSRIDQVTGAGAAPRAWPPPSTRRAPRG